MYLCETSSNSIHDLDQAYTVCIGTTVLVFVKLCVTAVDLWGKNDVDLYVQCPLFLTVLTQTCTMFRQCVW